jgi:hypothetical protein
MKLTSYITILSVLFLQICFSQEDKKSNNEELDEVEFLDGTSKTGKVGHLGLTSQTKNSKILFCNEKRKDCKKYKKSTIKQVIVRMRGNEPFIYKALYNPKRRKENPIISRVILKGEKYDFYVDEATGGRYVVDGRDTYVGSLIYITKKGSNQIEHLFRHTTNKKTLKKWTKMFEGCSVIASELDKKGKYIRKQFLEHYLEILDGCL